MTGSHDEQRQGREEEQRQGREEDLEAIRRRVLNVVGHELRTPVATLHGLAVELQHVSDLSQVTEVLGPSILRSATRLSALLDDLLIASGVSTATPVGRVEAIDLGAEVAECWAQVSTRPLEQVPRDWVVLVDRETARRAVRAILENAAVYGTDVPEVLIGQAPGGGETMVALTVLSPGPQLHEEEARLGPEPFFRGERAVTTRPGLGVGLAIADHVARAAGGWLTFGATEDGTRTVLALPGRRS